MHGYRRRKKPRSMHCVKTVEVARGKNGYGFTISGDAPCILSCIVHGSPAERAGLRTGDFLLNVNGLNVQDASHDDVVRLIGSSHGVLVLQIAENGRNSSDSSDNESRDYVSSKPKSKYQVRRGHRSGSARRDDPGRRASENAKYSGHQAQDDILAYRKHRSKVPRADSPTNREVEAYFQQYDAHHRQPFRKPDIENIDPYADEPYHQRRPRNVAEGRMDKQAVPTRHTKHTIITREHRLGLTKSANFADNFGVRHLAPAVADQREKNISSSSSSSTNTYLPMSGRIALSQRDVRYHVMDDDDVDGDVIMTSDNLRVVVGYVGSVEMPNEALSSTSRPQSIRNAVRRLQVERKVHTLVLMVISIEGVTLVNPMGNTVAVYPSDKVANSGINCDDKRFFDIVTSQGEVSVDVDFSSGGSCHVFMVDPELSNHTSHVSKAKHFGIQCSQLGDSGRCREFPRSAALIVTCINRLYHQKRLALVSQEGGAFAHVQQSNRENNTGPVVKPGEPDSRVYVVDMPQQRQRANSVNESNSIHLSDNSLPWAASGDSIKLNDTSLVSNQGNRNDKQGNTSTTSHIIDMDTSTDSRMSFQESNVSIDKFTIRAMPNPKVLPGKSDSWKNLLEDQNSAENLRRSMKKFLTTTRANESTSDVDSVHSLDLAIDPRLPVKPGGTSPQQMDVDESSPTPPLPPRNLRTVGSGSSLNAFQQFHSKIPPQPTNQSQAHLKPTQPTNNALMDSHKMPPPRIVPSHPTTNTKPPVAPGSILRTPQNRTQAERPKSTPPIQGYRAGIQGSAAPNDLDMEVDYDSDHGLQKSPRHAVNNKQNVGSTSTGQLPGAKQKTSVGDRHEGSLNRIRANSKLGASHESLAVNQHSGGDDASTGLGEQATSLTVVTSNGGLVSYQHGAGGVPLGRAAGWAVNFERLLRDKVGLANFTEFCKKEFSEENIVFWTACEEYRKTMNEKERRSLGVSIHKKHVCASAMQAVNIDSTCQSSLTLDKVNEADPELYDTARKQIFQLMKTDSYPRFLKSDLYKSCMTRELDGQALPHEEELSKPQPDAISTGSRDSLGKKSKFLKKSQSGAAEEGNEKRRRSLLPWGKKSKLTTKLSENDLIRSKKSLDPSIDQVVGNGELRSKDDSYAVEDNSEHAQKFVRVALPDGSTTVIYAKPSSTVRSAIVKLCERRNLDVDMVDVYNGATHKLVDVSRDVSKLGTRDIILEPRLVFRLDLPNRKSVGVKAPGMRSVRQAVAPVLERYGLNSQEHTIIEVSSSVVVGEETRVREMANKRLAVQHGKGRTVLVHSQSAPSHLGQSALSVSSEHLFTALFQGDPQVHARFDAEGVLDFEKKEDKQTKDENRMSGIISNLLRKNSMDAKEGKSKTSKRSQMGNGVGTHMGNGVPKAVPNGKAVPDGRTSIPARIRNDNEDLKVFALLSKVSSQFDDQRGPLRKQDLELPDFLKPKPSESNERVQAPVVVGSPLRKTDMHSSDTSLYEPHTEERDTLERMRKLSNSEERVDNLLMKQFRGSSRNKSGYSIHSSYTSAVKQSSVNNNQPQQTTTAHVQNDAIVTSQQSFANAQNVTPESPSKFPYMDASFTSTDGVLPSHLDAEDLFQAQHAKSSPDFNRSGLMEKSRVDFGGVVIPHSENSNNTKQELSRTSKSVFRELIPSSMNDSSAIGRHKHKPSSPSHLVSHSASHPPSHPVPAPRRAHSRKHRSANQNEDTDSVTSELSTNSSDLDHTLLPPSDDSDTSHDRFSGSNPKHLPNTPRGMLQLDPSRQTFFPASPRTTSRGGVMDSSAVSGNAQRPLKEQSITWAAMHHGRVTHGQLSPLPHASYRTGIHATSSRTHSQSSANSSLSSPRSNTQHSPRNSTPSPTTHDLILAPESSSDEQSQENSPALPVPAKRTTLHKNSATPSPNHVNTSLENVIERGQSVQRAYKQRINPHPLAEQGVGGGGEGEVQVSYV